MWKRRSGFLFLLASLMLFPYQKNAFGEGIRPVNPPNPSRPSDRRIVPVGTPVYLRITQADDEAFIQINGQTVLSARWNRGPGSNARSVSLRPGAYKIRFVVINTQKSNAGGIFDVLVAGKPLTNQRIGISWGPNSNLGVIYDVTADLVIEERDL
jgi:hypothetical protein